MSSKNTLNATPIAFLHLLATAFVAGFKAGMGYGSDFGDLLTAFRTQLTNDLGGLATSIFEVVIVIFIIGALIGNIANVTTGITIAHTGFTPNPNLTASPGAVPLTQLYPLVFVAIGLMAAFAYFKHVG